LGEDRRYPALHPAHDWRPTGNEGSTHGVGRTYVLVMVHPSGLTEERLALLYNGEGFGGEKTIRARVIRELIDEIRVLRSELLQDGTGQDGLQTGR
jgi:hypothetical protein